MLPSESMFEKFNKRWLFKKLSKRNMEPEIVHHERIRTTEDNYSLHVDRAISPLIHSLRNQILEEWNNKREWGPDESRREKKSCVLSHCKLLSLKEACTGVRETILDWMPSEIKSYIGREYSFRKIRLLLGIKEVKWAVVPSGDFAQIMKEWV